IGNANARENGVALIGRTHPGRQTEDQEQRQKDVSPHAIPRGAVVVKWVPQGTAVPFVPEEGAKHSSRPAYYDRGRFACTAIDDACAAITLSAPLANAN